MITVIDVLPGVLAVMLVSQGLASSCLRARCAAATVTVTVHTNRPIYVTNELFLSLGLDSNLIRNRWETFNFHATRLRTLAKALSPAYLRLSGTDADRIIYQEERNTKPADIDIEGTRVSNVYPFPLTNFTMTSQDWDSINKFAMLVGWRVTFGINAQLRRGSDWDATNARELLAYSVKRGYAHNLDFQLGNEPDLYSTDKRFQVITPAQLAKDTRYLRTILDKEFGSVYKNSHLVGPELAFTPNSWYLKTFLDSMDDDVIIAASFHHYYGSGDIIKHVDNYTDPKILDSYKWMVDLALYAVGESSIPQIKVWQGETSSVYSPPGSAICETFVAGFMLLDKLGMSARMGLDLVIRQTFYGFWFALVDRDLNPTPNYWVSVLYRRLVGRRVLDLSHDVSGVSIGNDDNKLRLYCHCTSAHAPLYEPGSITIYGMNLHDEDYRLALIPAVMDTFRNITEYILQPPKTKPLDVKSVALNGAVLKLIDDFTLPPLKGRVLPPSSYVIIPSKSLVFYVVSDANASACKE